jgi:hypothetical protein
LAPKLSPHGDEVRDAADELYKVMASVLPRAEVAEWPVQPLMRLQLPLEISDADPIPQREGRSPVAAKSLPRTSRSALTNGKRLLPGVDGRGPWVRRCRDIIAEHISDLGGADNCSAAERSIVRRAAVLTTELERLEVRFAQAGEASAEDLDIYARIAANLRRLLEAIGLQRRPRDLTPPDPLIYAAQQDNVS